MADGAQIQIIVWTAFPIDVSGCSAAKTTLAIGSIGLGTRV
jgi:hypothetical protein